MDPRNLRLASYFIMATGVAFLFSQYQGISGFAIGEGALASHFNMGAIILILGFTLFVLASRMQKDPAENTLMSKTELQLERKTRDARERFIELYAKEPNRKELEYFMERMKKSRG